jgi:FKBP-type peptidyl-prolyl cis-trans isomerase FklB
MKKYLSAAVAASLAAAAASLPMLPTVTRADDTLKTDQDKVSYSMGVDMGRNLQKQGIEVNPDVLLNGIKDGMAGGAAVKMTDEEMQATMHAFIQNVMQKKSDDNKKKGDQFLAENKKKDGWQSTTSGLQYKVITTGTGAKPAATDTVVVNYRGTLIDGTEFDSTYKRNEPAEFPVNQVIPGWTEALQLMPVGSKWDLVIPSNLAYGENGPPGIGANSVLQFEVELLNIKKGDASGGSNTPGAPAAPGN